SCSFLGKIGTQRLLCHIRRNATGGTNPNTGRAFHRFYENVIPSLSLLFLNTRRYQYFDNEVSIHTYIHPSIQTYVLIYIHTSTQSYIILTHTYITTNFHTLSIQTNKT